MGAFDAVLWHVIPNSRRDAVLNKQAEFIDRLGRGVWRKVIIVCKESMKPERDGEGALKAAADFCEESKAPKVIGYRFLSDLDEEQKAKLEADDDLRRSFNVLNDAEIRDLVETSLQSVEAKERVELRVDGDYKCMDCGEVGDPRLMSLHCHMESHHVHPKGVHVVHPEPIRPHHANDVQVAEHSGPLQKAPWFDFAARGKKRYKCCGKSRGKPGCTVVWSCCRKRVLDNEENNNGCKESYGCCGLDPSEASSSSGCEPRHECCGRKPETELGCVELCRKCDGVWGSAAQKCFKKEHNVTRKSVDVAFVAVDKRSAEKPETKDKYVFGLPPIVTAKPF